LHLNVLVFCGTKYGSKMNETIFSLAYLQYMHEVLGKDIIDCYVPLFCKCIIKEGATEIDVKKLKDSMSSLYGISNLTSGAIDTILNRMASSNYSILSKNNGRFYVNEPKLTEYEVKLNKDDRIKEEFDSLVSNITEYSKRFENKYSKEDVEEGLFNFLDIHGIDLLNGEGSKIYDSIIQHQDKRLSYVISRFIVDNNRNGGNAIDVINRLAKGYAITKLVCFKGLSKYNGRLDGITVFIDTPFFYNLLGANDKANQESSYELMSILDRNGANFAIFNHNLNEVHSCFKDAIDRLRTGNYDIRKSSRLLTMAVTEGFSSLQLESMYNRIEPIKSKWNITPQDAPESKRGYSEIDAKRLTKIISKAYTKNRNRHIFSHEMNMIGIDVDSISYIYRIRGNEIVQSLKGCKAILLTTNRVIAAASSDTRISSLNHDIPACVTDVFLSTILWTNNPSESESLNRKLLLCECYNNIQLNDLILARFLDDIKKKRLAEELTENQYLNITTSRLALDLLADKTQNDINAYTDRTVNEILYILEQERQAEINKVKEEGEKRLKEEQAKNKEEINKQQEQHDKELAEKDTTIGTLSSTVDYTDQKCKKYANLGATIISVLVFLFLCSLFLLNRYIPKEYWKTYTWAFWVFNGLDLIFVMWSLWNLCGRPWKFARLKDYLYKKFYNKLCSIWMGRDE